MPFAKSKDCLCALPASKEGTAVWQGKPMKDTQCLSMGWGQRCREGVSWLIGGDVQNSLHYPDSQRLSQIPGLEAASGARNLAHHARQESLVPVQVPSRVKAIFKAAFPLGVGYSNIDEAPCVCLLLELAAIAWPRSWLGHGPKALLAICCGWAYGHRASALSQWCMFPARRIERKDEICHH